MSETVSAAAESPRAEGFLSACTDTVDLIGELDPPDLDAFKSWQVAWDSNSLSTWITSARDAGIRLHPGLISLWLHSILHHWHGTGRESVDWLETIYDTELEADGSLPEKLLRHLLKALSEAGRIDLNDGLPTELYSGDGIIELGEILLASDYPELAKRVANGAARLLDRVDALSVKALRLATRAAFAASQPEDAALKLGVLAFHPGVGRLDQFDALESCLRWITVDERGKALLRFLVPQMKSDAQSSSLDLYLKGLVRGLDPAQVGYADAERIRSILVEGDIAKWAVSVNSVLSELSAIERSRLALMPPIPERALSTEWSTFSFRHRAFERSIPISDALRLTAQGEEIALLVHHETTHVYSMMGAVGWSLLAIRAAILECEIYLMTGERRAREQRDPLGHEAAPPLGSLTPIGDYGPVALLDVERQLDLIRKSQIITDIWRPWFEGVAVLSELCDDSTQDNVFSPSMSVLYNLFDLGAFFDAPVMTPDKAEALLASHMAGVDAYYRATVENIGRYRLRNYLNDPGHRMHYLPGYLAVRRVVAAWRSAVDRTSGASLHGAALTRLLLHVTRFASEKTVPAPDLPLDSFEESARALFADWMKSLTEITAADLMRAVATYQRFAQTPAPIRWADGKLVEVVDSAGTVEIAMFNRIAEAAAGSMVTTNNDPARVAEADPHCFQVIQLTSSSMSENRREPSWRQQVWTEVMHPYSILEIAEAESPFWLIPDAPALAVLLRTREKDVRTGRSGHNVLSIPIGKEEADRLAATVRSLGSGRMRIRRLADLSEGGDGDEVGAGRQYLVFDYGDWRKIYPMGLRFSADFASTQVEDDIAVRLAPGLLSQLDQRDLASGQAPAARARAWIDEAPKWEIDGISFAPWAAHVGRLADAILRPETERGASDWASAYLLEFALGDAALAAKVTDRGLSALLGDEDPARLTALLHFLDLSARAPPTELPSELSQWRHASKGRAGWDFDPLIRQGATT